MASFAHFSSNLKQRAERFLDQQARRDAMMIYVACVAILGVALAMRATPMSGIDEAYHFKRALQISEGHVFARKLGVNNWGGEIDGRLLAYENWFDDRRNEARQSLAPEAAAAETAMARLPPGRITVSFPSTASFPPVPYLPAACGLLLAKLAGFGLSGQVHAGRLGSLAGWLGLVLLAIRILPAGRFGTLALLTMPAAIGVAASYSADPMTNGLSCLFIASCLRLNIDATCVCSQQRKLGLLALTACLGLLKLTCALLSVAIVLVPKRYFQSASQAWLFRMSGLALAFGTAGVWNWYYNFVPGQYWGYGAQPHETMRMILAAPAYHLALVAWNIYTSFYTYWSDAFSRFGNGPLPLWMWFNGPVTESALLILLGLAMSEAQGHAVTRKAGVLLILLAGAYAFQTVLAFKIGFSRPGATIIEGVQGRYWILPYVMLYLGAILAIPGQRLLRLAIVPCLVAWLATDTDFVLAALKGYAANWH